MTLRQFETNVKILKTASNNGDNNSKQTVVVIRGATKICKFQVHNLFEF